MLELRPASPAEPDAVLLNDEVQRWYVEIYGGPDEDPVEPDAFAPPRGGFLIGYLDGEPVAMGGWTSSPGAPGDAKIRRMYARPSVRRQGVAGALLDALEADAAAAGAHRAVLTTGRPQQAAIAFYRTRGYVDIDPFGFHAASPTAVHLGRALPPAAPERRR